MNKGLDEIEMEAIHLGNALKGLELFVDDRFGVVSGITTDDLSALDGLTAAVSKFAKLHSDNVKKFNDDGDDDD
ncbi:hypothetical protein [Enterococcus sp. DIV0800]|uniref:hypothetical protein n=1 Tax=unclassified Enterococcus TaxID=2608891 RepID=UPI003D3003E8